MTITDKELEQRLAKAIREVLVECERYTKSGFEPVVKVSGGGGLIGQLPFQKLDGPLVGPLAGIIRTHTFTHVDDMNDDELTGLHTVSPETHTARDATGFRRVVAAKEALELAEQALREAIDDARRDGDSWTVIGAALGTSRQNAFQRFGKVLGK